MGRLSPADGADLARLAWVVRYVPHEVMEDYNATYNVEYKGKEITTHAAVELGIPRGEI